MSTCLNWSHIRVDPDHVVDWRGSSALHIAAAEGCVLDVIRMVETGAENALAAERIDGFMAAHKAAFAGRTEVLQFLVGKMDYWNRPTMWGATILHLAAGKGHLATIAMLVEEVPGLDLNVPNNVRGPATPLTDACRAGHLPVVVYLCERLTDSEIEISQPLHAAVRFEGGFLDVVHYLVNCTNVSLSLIDEHGKMARDYISDRKVLSDILTSADAMRLEALQTVVTLTTTKLPLPVARLVGDYYYGQAGWVRGARTVVF